MANIHTPTELLLQFPQLNFNLQNKIIFNQLTNFLIYRNTKKTKLTANNIRRFVREFFKDTYKITFPNTNNVSTSYWIARGFSPTEAKEKAENFYKDKIKGKRVLPTQLEYYINKGMSSAEAKKALTNEQSKRTKNIKRKTKTSNNTTCSFVIKNKDLLTFDDNSLLVEFSNLFPYAQLNISNTYIKSLLLHFIKTNYIILERKWSTVGVKLKSFFKEENCELLGKTPNQIIFWESRGWDNPAQKVLDNKNYFPTSIEYWLKKGFSPTEAKEKAENFYKNKIKGKRLLPTQLEYYTNKGQSSEEAKQSLKNEQAKRADKLVQKELENPELRKRRLWTQIEYYTNKGYSEEVGYQLMQEKFKERNLQTMKKLTQKYIDKGQDEFTALESAQKDYKKRAKNIMKTRIENKSFGWQKASKQSIKFFQPLMDYLDSNQIEYYVGNEQKQEWFIAKGTEYFYSYDFYIPSKKLIIEYNGEHIHPNPEMSKEKWNNWKHCWSKKSANECRELDLKKIKLAESMGYKVIEIFESAKISSLELI